MPAVVLFPVFLSGLENSVSPCGRVSLLIFFALLCFVGRTAKDVFLSGILFIATVLVTNFLMIFGAFDSLLEHTGTWILIRTFYFGLAACFIVVGSLYLKDWWQYRQDGENFQARLKLPPCIEKGHALFDGSTSRSWGWRQFTVKDLLLIVFLPTILGYVMMMLGSVWPQDYYIFIVLATSGMEGESTKGLLALAYYNLAFILPFIVVWLVILFTVLSEKFKLFLVKHVQFVRIIFSSLFISSGIASIIFLIR